jgi:hypothetical protein
MGDKTKKAAADPELDAHLAQRLPQLAQEARDARAAGNQRVEDVKHQTIDAALSRWAQRNH